MESAGFAPFSELLVPHLRRLLPKKGIAAALAGNTAEGQGLQLWRAMTKDMDPSEAAGAPVLQRNLPMLLVLLLLLVLVLLLLLLLLALLLLLLTLLLLLLALVPPASSPRMTHTSTSA